MYRVVSRLCSLVSVLKPHNIRLVKLAEREFQALEPVISGYGAVYHQARHPVLITLFYFPLGIIKNNDGAAFEHAVEFIPMVVILQRERLVWLDGQDFYAHWLAHGEPVK